MTDLTLNQEIKPAINQIELHPYRQQCLQRETAEHFNIAVEAWSPFNQGKDGIFNDPTLNTIAQKYGKSIPQVILRWQTQLGIITIPKSTHIERIKENYDIFDFQLTSEELKKIANLDRAPDSTGPRENRELVERLHQIDPDTSQYQN